MPIAHEAGNWARGPGVVRGGGGGKPPPGGVVADVPNRAPGKPEPSGELAHGGARRDFLLDADHLLRGEAVGVGAGSVCRGGLFRAVPLTLDLPIATGAEPLDVQPVLGVVPVVVIAVDEGLPRRASAGRLAADVARFGTNEHA